MFSYRHAFHAGNHADVLKHCVFLHILNYFNRKPTPYWVIDTHAGAGVYDLDSEWPQTNLEFESGIMRLISQNDLPEDLADYVDFIQDMNGSEDLQFYPGSPWLALELMRAKDRLRLFEMHPSEITILEDNIAQQDQRITRQVAIFQRDGFSGLKSQLPPPTRRAITLIDPSYEDKADYKAVQRCIHEGLERFQTGCYLVWYPLVQRKEVYDMLHHLERIQGIEWLHATLTIKKPATDGYGLHGSGMFVINPPYTLYPSLEQVMPYLVKHLGQDAQASFSLKRNNT